MCSTEIFFCINLNTRPDQTILTSWHVLFKIAIGHLKLFSWELVRTLRWRGIWSLHKQLGGGRRRRNLKVRISTCRIVFTCQCLYIIIFREIVALINCRKNFCIFTFDFYCKWWILIRLKPHSMRVLSWYS